jgi:type I restriction enzyme, S subunit
MLRTCWPAVPIEDLCVRVTSGGTPSRINPAYYDGGTIPWIKTGELRGWYVDDIAERITPAAVRESSAKVFPPETVLLAMYGDGKTMGSVGLIRTPAATNQACCAMLADPHKCDPKFLMYSLVYFKPAILKLAISGAQRNLNGKSIKQFAIGAPPVEVQQRIASILSAYDELIENNTRRIALLEEMARRIYEEWFVRFRFPGFEAVRMVESEMGLVPEGWRVMPLADMVDTQYGYTESAQDKPVGPKFLRGMDINKQPYIDWSAVPYCPIDPDEFPKFKLGVGDVVVIRMADPGKIGIIEKAIDAVFASYLVRLRITDRRMTPYFLFYLLTGERYQGYITGVSTGTTRKSASAPVITGINVVMPTQELMKQFNDYVVPLRCLLNTLLDNNCNLRTTRDLLLPKLISGELDVSAMSEPEAVAI